MTSGLGSRLFASAGYFRASPATCCIERKRRTLGVRHVSCRPRRVGQALSEIRGLLRLGRVNDGLKTLHRNNLHETAYSGKGMKILRPSKRDELRQVGLFRIRRLPREQAVRVPSDGLRSPCQQALWSDEQIQFVEAPIALSN